LFTSLMIRPLKISRSASTRKLTLEL